MPTRSCACDLHLPPLAQIKTPLCGQAATTCNPPAGSTSGPHQSDYPFNYLLHDYLLLGLHTRAQLGDMRGSNCGACQLEWRALRAQPGPHMYIHHPAL